MGCDTARAKGPSERVVIYKHALREAMSESMLEVRDLAILFRLPRRMPWGPHSRVHAVDVISFAVPNGTTFGLVGEKSGSGKSTTALAVMRLVEITSGWIRLGDTVPSDLEDEALRLARRDFQIIFQAPSLNPRTRTGDMKRESLDLMGVGAAGPNATTGWRTSLPSRVCRSVSFGERMAAG